VTGASPGFPPPGGPPGPRLHPLAVASGAVAVLGFVGVPVLPGLVAAPLGAVARRNIRRRPDRWSGAHIAMVGVVLGLIGACVPLGALAIARRDDWTLLPLGAVLAYAALVVTFAIDGDPGAGRRRLVAATLTVGIGGALVAVVFLLVLAVGFFFQFTARSIAEAFTESLSDAFCSRRA
jgi:hypothetical protein